MLEVYKARIREDDYLYRRIFKIKYLRLNGRFFRSEVVREIER